MTLACLSAKPSSLNVFITVLWVLCLQSTLYTHQGVCKRIPQVKDKCIRVFYLQLLYLQINSALLMLNVQTDTDTLSQTICPLISITSRTRSFLRMVKKKLTGAPGSCDCSEHDSSCLPICMDLWVIYSGFKKTQLRFLQINDRSNIIKRLSHKQTTRNGRNSKSFSPGIWSFLSHSEVKINSPIGSERINKQYWNYQSHLKFGFKFTFY